MRCHKFSVFGDNPCLVLHNDLDIFTQSSQIRFHFFIVFLFFFHFLHFSIHWNLPFGHIFFLRGSVLRFESNLSNRWTLWQRLSELSVGFLRRFRLKMRCTDIGYGLILNDWNIEDAKNRNWIVFFSKLVRCPIVRNLNANNHYSVWESLQCLRRAQDHVLFCFRNSGVNHHSAPFGMCLLFRFNDFTSIHSAQMWYGWIGFHGFSMIFSSKRTCSKFRAHKSSGTSQIN